jgi:hypothetical protein
MWTKIKSVSVLVIGFMLCAWTATTIAQPGTPISPTAALSDQKQGSVLIYNYYTSSGSNPAAKNTRVSITNTNPTEGVAVHFFLVDGTAGTQSDFFICLVPNQTTWFLTSNYDPGSTGYIVAVAVAPTGCPRSFNYLLGDEYVKIDSGHATSFGAEAIAALYTGTLGSCGGASATLSFDGISYNQLPRRLMVDKIRSPANGNSMLLIVNRIGGNLTSGPSSTIGTVNGELCDDLGAAHNFSFTHNQTQLVATLSDSFLLTTPVFSSVIPTGRTGWMSFAADTEAALFGVAINFNTTSSATRGGYNLRTLSLATSSSVVIPIFVPIC